MERKFNYSVRVKKTPKHHGIVFRDLLDEETLYMYLVAACVVSNPENVTLSETYGKKEAEDITDYIGDEEFFITDAYDEIEEFDRDWIYKGKKYIATIMARGVGYTIMFNDLKRSRKALLDVLDSLEQEEENQKDKAKIRIWEKKTGELIFKHR